MLRAVIRRSVAHIPLEDDVKLSNARASICWLYTRMAGSRSDTENGNLDEHRLTTWKVCLKRIGHYINVLLALILLLLTNSAHAVSITYGPFAWPLDPSDGGYPTSVKVIWWTDSATSSNTAYVGTTPSGPWTYTGLDPTQSTRHEAVITGLAGGETYYLYVTSNAVSSSVVQFRTGKNELTNGSFESWHSVSGQDWGTEEPDGWHGWEIYPWSPPGSNNPNHIAISKDRNTGVPSPLTKDGSHRVGMDEGWRSCYGGIYQEVTGLAPGTYTFSGWVAWLFEGIAYPSKHRVEIVVKDGQHVPGEIPTGYVVFGQDGTVSDQTWRYVQASVVCASGTLTIYANLRSDNWDGKSFAHFDAFRVMSESEPAVRFSNFQSTYSVNGNSYDITLTYDTDIPTTTQVEWGPSTSYGNTSSLNPELVTHHVVQLTAVSPSVAPYHYRALATAPGDINEFSGDQTFDAPEIVLSSISSSVDMQTGTICTIRWTTNYGTTANKVCYRRVGETDYSEFLESDSTPHTDHVVSLTGLRLGATYEFHVVSGGTNIIPSASSPDNVFQTPAEPGMTGLYIGMAMIGGDLIDNGDDVGPARDVQTMIERDCPVVNIAGLSSYHWPECQPTDPGDGPNVYDWSSGDARNENLIAGKSRVAYYQVYGNCPSWLTFDSERYWQKFEEFIEAMTVHMNEKYGDVDFIFDNEPNISRAPDGWNWADWYMHCLRHFYVAVHRADARTGRTNRVIAGNLCGHSAGGFADLYQRGLKDYSDVLGYHPYPYDIRNGLEVSDLAQIHAIQVAYGDGNKKIFVSEGWGSGRSAGFDRSSPTLEMPPEEVENMYLAMVNGWDNVMTPRTNWDPSYLYGMKFFCGNDNWGACGWRARAQPQKDGSGNIVGFIVDGYWMTPDIAPQFWNGGMLDWYGNSKDCLIHVFPGNGLVFMNPGFELKSSPPNAHLPHFWTPYDVSAPSAFYGVDTSVFRSGSSSLKLTHTAARNDGVYQTTAKRSVIPGVQYRARVWCKTENVTGLGARFYMRFKNLDGSQQSAQYWATNLTGTADWQLMEVMATAPAFASRVEVGCYLTGMGTAWFDDVIIARLDQELIGVIRGYTVDEGHHIVPHAIVRTTSGGYQTLSDETGYYEIHGVEAGTYDLVCRKEGYLPFKVKNQTVAPGKLTFASFCLGIPKPGLTITAVTLDKSAVAVGEGPVSVTVNVANSKPYPVIVSDVGVFVERNGQDATGSFSIKPSPANPKTIPALGNAGFEFTLMPLPESNGSLFTVNAYAFGQEDRPNLLTNGNFDLSGSEWTHWGFSGGASTCQWLRETADVFSSPYALKHVVADSRGDKFNWASNYSAWGADSLDSLSQQELHSRGVSQGQ
ncbi:MAG: carboxypeptidase regulatory-like domain-containing protein [Armatimonadetes bacterium]|nr:carboxypeptidase regulatory-like domain-containing protein [Armatimonadota bacterium]